MVDLNNNSKWENEVYIKQSGDAVKKNSRSISKQNRIFKGKFRGFN